MTTVDPYDSLNDATPTDAERQAYYDATPNLMHTIVGSQVRGAPGTPGLTPNGKWFSDGADGVSPGIGVVAGVSPGLGQHTNWMFTEDQAGATTGGVINGEYIGSISAHENAHSFGLYHQGDWTGDTRINEYTNGDENPGDGSYVAIIGNASDRQRVAWRVGDADVNGVRVNVNDVQSMLATNVANNGRAGALELHLVNDGIGHTRLTATPLPLIGDAVDPALAQGVIVPLSEADPEPLGAANYTQDWFSFYSDGGDAISLTVTNGTSFLAPGVADGVGMLRSTLSIYDSVGSLIGAGVEDVSTLYATYSSALGAGTYFAQIASYGGHEQISPMFNAAQYFDMGAYFLTGSGFDAIPEPGTLVLFALAWGSSDFVATEANSHVFAIRLGGEPGCVIVFSGE